MITNTGKDIIAKYLINQAPSYASYMAFGSGPQPIQSPDPLGNYATTENLDFEMFRVPIISRGYVTELVGSTEVSKIVFTAELPTNQRYQISEVGIYSAKSNPSAGAGDSRIIYTFAESENWQYHDQSSETKIQSFTGALYGASNDGIIKVDQSTYPVFRTSSDNAIFDSAARTDLYEKGRFLDTILMIPGNTSHLLVDGTTGELAPRATSGSNYYGTHIHLSGTQVDLSKNSTEDEIKLAYSIVNRNEDSSYDFSKVRILVEFSSDDTTLATNYAKFQIVNTYSTYATSRYQVATSKLSALKKSPTFTWNSIALARIFATIFDSVNISSASADGSTATITTARKHGFKVGDVVTIAGVSNTSFNGEYTITAVSDTDTAPFTFSYEKSLTATSSGGTAEAPSSNYYLSLDALRFENVTSVNPLYGLTGYSVIRTEDGQPISKDSNTSNLVEFRFGLDVV